MSFHSRFHHTRLSTALFFSICYMLCSFPHIFFSLRFSLSLSLTLFHSSFIYRVLSSLTLCTCACVCVFVYVRFHFFWLLQHVIKFFFSRPAMKHDSPQICAMIRSISVAAVAPNRISMHHDATMVSPINQQPIVPFFVSYQCTFEEHSPISHWHGMCGCVRVHVRVCKWIFMQWKENELTIECPIEMFLYVSK